ncbi:MAG: flagellar biosynthesis protein FlhF [Leptospiraceae bacterium]|nr:flagellar biosynthesis protein FlhF [Leptospiraceae bacterium]
MEYVKISAKSHAEAYKKVVELYGNDVIIHSEQPETEPTFLGKILGKKVFTIRVSIPEKNEKKKTAPKPSLAMPVEPRQRPVSTRSVQSKIDDLQSLLDKRVAPSMRETSAREIDEFLGKIEKINKLSSDTRPAVRTTLEKDLGRTIEMSAMNGGSDNSYNMAVLSSEIRGIKDAITGQKPLPADSLAERNFEELLDAFLDSGMTRAYSKMLIDEIKNALPPNEWKTPKRIYVAAKNALISRIRVNSILGSRRVVVLVGPTGAGKTTTQAKLAAHLIAREKRKVALVTTDTYRIAATEQMKIYGNIMATPVHVCKSPSELQKVLEEEKASAIVVDTAGISPGDTARFDEQAAYFSENRSQFDIHLVLPATCKRSDAMRIMERYDAVSFDKVILSKIDETDSFGAFIELADGWHRPFSFFTHGQDVPRDYKEADRILLAEKTLARWSDSVHADLRI